MDILFDGISKPYLSPLKSVIRRGATAIKVERITRISVAATFSELQIKPWNDVS